MQGGSLASVRSALRGWSALGAVMLMAGLVSGGAHAEPDQPRTELFTGFETSDNYTSGYLGGGYAFGGLHERGLRLRAGWRLRAIPL